MKRREADDFARSSAIGTAIIIVVAAAVFGAMLYWMYSVKLLILPESVTRLFGIGGGDTQDAVPWDTSELQGVVRSGKSTETTALTFDVNYANLRAALLSQPEPEGIYLSVSVSYYNDGARTSRLVRFRRDGSSFRIEKYADDTTYQLKMLITADETTLHYIDNTNGEDRSIPRADAISPENEAGLPSVDELLEVVAQFPEADATADDPATADTTAASVGNESSAGESPADETARYTDCQIAMLRSGGQTVYYIAFHDRELDLDEEYYMSLDNRVIISHRTMRGGELLYSCETTGFSSAAEDYAI